MRMQNKCYLANLISPSLCTHRTVNNIPIALLQRATTCFLIPLRIYNSSRNAVFVRVFMFLCAFHIYIYKIHAHWIFIFGENSNTWHGTCRAHFAACIYLSVQYICRVGRFKLHYIDDINARGKSKLHMRVRNHQIMKQI